MTRKVAMKAGMSSTIRCGERRVCLGDAVGPEMRTQGCREEDRAVGLEVRLEERRIRA